MQGTDHMQPRPDLPSLLHAADEALADQVVHSTLPAYLAAVQAELGDDGLETLPHVHGELRSPERAHLLPAVLSARIWIKQWNARCEWLLTHWAEPFGALAEHVGDAHDLRGFLRAAWHWLLQNHPHDSICGCSVDQVHREMQARFAWAEQIAEQVTQASLETLAQHIPRHDLDPETKESTRVIVFNPSTFPRTGRVRVRLPFTPMGDWSLVDASGTATPYRVLRRITHEPFQAQMDREALTDWLGQIAAGQGPSLGSLVFQQLDLQVEDGVAHLDVTMGPKPPVGGVEQAQQDALGRILALLTDPQIEQYRVRVIEDAGLDVEFLARDVPGLGYDQLSIQADLGAANVHAPDAKQAPQSTPDVTSPPPNRGHHRIENEFFTVEAEPADGTLTVTDKGTGLILRGVNHFVDGGDRGDEYTYCPPEQDCLVGAPTAAPTIRRVDDGLGSSLEIRALYRVPCSLEAGTRSARSTNLVDLPITSRVRLTPGVRRIEFETTVVNAAQDHRLRVHVPTPIATDRSWAEGHFDVVERPLALPTETEGWAEQPSGTHPQRTFVDVTDGQHGLLLANQGLPEYEVLPGTAEAPGVTLALTLLRCVGWLSRGDLHNRSGHAGPMVPTPEAQCPGEHTFHYALVPHPGNYLSAYREAHAFNVPLRAVCTDAHASSLPARGSFLAVSPAAVVISAVKPPEEGEGLIVRVYNSAPVPVEAQLTLWQPVREAALVRLDEATPIRRLAAKTDTITLPLRAKEIATLQIQFTLPEEGG
jgi:alpha-mannosidase